MRRALLIPAALLASLAVAAPAGAADQTVRVPDFFFTPRQVSIDPGDAVTWSFQHDTEHTTTSTPGQGERWNSRLKGNGESFVHTFDKPGKFQYICQPHPFMKGTVTVGKDAVAKSFTKLRVKGSARGVKATITLKEAAKVTLSVKGPKRKKVTKRLKAGKRSISLGKLSAGSYKVTVVAQDEFDKKTTKRATANVG
jgi:plastocyanin